MTTDYLDRAGKPRLAFARTRGAGPCAVFLGGFRSDMEGTKALHLERTCRERGQAFVRFDYSGHGVSEGRFEDGTIGGWLDDALDVIDGLTEGPVVLAGSSMGGWIGLLAARARPQRVAGFVGIAAAPDFTGEFYGEQLTPERQDALAAQGFFLLDTPYGEPYVITKRLIEESRAHFLLRGSGPDLKIPVRLLQGMRDPEVPWPVALRLVSAIGPRWAEAFLIADGDHRLSRPQDLDVLDAVVREVSDIVAGKETAAAAPQEFVPCRIRPESAGPPAE